MTIAATSVLDKNINNLALGSFVEGKSLGVQQLLNAQQFAFNKGTEGKVVDILVERAGGRDGQIAGRSPYMQAVNFIGYTEQIGKIVPCRLFEARQNSMTGDIVNLKGVA